MYLKAMVMVFFTIHLSAQPHNPLIPPNTYQSSQNPFYWKNRKPYPGYWQQDVHYEIKANLDEQTDIIDGSLRLTYTNNSPDTLHFVYLHLYQNAFQPGSYLDNLQESNRRQVRYGKYESQKLGTVISRLQSEGTDLKQELDNTILKVWLAEPLPPDGEVIFEIDFKTYFDRGGSVRRRMKVFDAWGHKHYDGVHWYPRICVYDRKFGWDVNQHLGREFYGEFGTYDVELTFANNYVVGATGNLLNPEEAMPPALRKQLDISNFLDKEWNSPPSTIIEYSSDPSTRKTWKFHAENVHDFAFTADATYRIGETWIDMTPYYKGVRVGFDKVLVQALVQEPHAAGWRTATEFTAKVIQCYSQYIGPYGYPKMIVADARDGMEYPMLTLDGGFDPSYRDLIAHEVGHNWFFGMVGNNETYRAFLDEGFTEFIDAHALEVIDGPYLRSSTYNLTKWEQKFKRPWLARDGEAYWGYMGSAAAGDDATLNTHSDGFGGALEHGGGYRHVYYKTATMLYNLQYVLGDSLFWRAMQFYFDRWKFCHPYPEDFRQAIIDYTQVDLNWFFDQWLETEKKIDYAVKSVKPTKAPIMPITGSHRRKSQVGDSPQPPRPSVTPPLQEGSLQRPHPLQTATPASLVVGQALLEGSPQVRYSVAWPNGIGNATPAPLLSEEGQGWYAITFKRKERMEMPIDFAVVTDVDTFYFHIPNRWFIKQTSATVLPKWHGWDKLNPEYTAYVHVEGNVKDIIIDPSGRLADVFMPDNEWHGPSELHFDSRTAQYPDWRKYHVYWGPSLWYNEYDGLKLGLRLHGDYMKMDNQFDVSVWIHPGVGANMLLPTVQPPDPDTLSPLAYLPLSYQMSIRNMWQRISRKLFFHFSGFLGEGFIMHKTGLEFHHRGYDLDLFLKAVVRPFDNGPKYSLYPDEWQVGKINHTGNIALGHNYRLWGGSGRWKIAVRSTATFSDYQWNDITFEKTWTRNLGPLQLRKREYARYTTGNPAPESALYLAGASPEDILDNKWTRSAGFIPSTWGGFSENTNHFHAGGGLNLRGYAGYYGVETDTAGNQHVLYRGNSGLSISGELDFDGLIRFRPRFLRHFHLDTYIYGDAGAITYVNAQGKQVLAGPRADAGAGCVLTIRDWWHFDEWQPLLIRFDFPLWLSHTPFVDPEFFQFRWIVGVGRSF